MNKKSLLTKYSSKIGVLVLARSVAGSQSDKEFQDRIDIAIAYVFNRLNRVIKTTPTDYKKAGQSWLRIGAVMADAKAW